MSMCGGFAFRPGLHVALTERSISSTAAADCESMDSCGSVGSSTSCVDTQTHREAHHMHGQMDRRMGGWVGRTAGRWVGRQEGGKAQGHWQGIEVSSWARMNSWPIKSSGPVLGARPIYYQLCFVAPLRPALFVAPSGWVASGQKKWRTCGVDNAAKSVGSLRTSGGGG